MNLNSIWTLFKTTWTSFKNFSSEFFNQATHILALIKIGEWCYQLISYYQKKAHREEVERNQLRQWCSQKIEDHTAAGTRRSHAPSLEIFTFLHEKGTPVAYEILKEQVESGRVAESYLKKRFF